MKNKKAIAVLLALVFLVAAALLSGFPGSAKGAKIQVSPASFDFGAIELEAVEHNFQLKNVGDAPLGILRVSTSCACTTAWVDTETIQPNQETTLHVRFDPLSMEEPVRGDVLRVVYIKSNDALHPEIEIEIKATVLEERR